MAAFVSLNWLDRVQKERLCERIRSGSAFSDPLLDEILAGQQNRRKGRNQ